MFVDKRRKLVLAAASVFISSAVIALGYETFKAYQYRRWKAAYAETGEWSGMLTIPSENEVLMWEYRPSYQYLDPRRQVVIKTNRFGFRDDERSQEREAGALRIAFVGDSITLGQTVSAEATFVRKFEEYAGRALADSKLEALNFGIDGYNALQIAELLRTRVIEFEPSAVAYVMCLNDFDLEEASGGKIRYFRRPRSFLLGALETVYQRVLARDYHEYYFEKHKGEVLEAVREMRDILESKSISFRVALIPVFRESQESFLDYDLRGLHQSITGMLRGEGIQVSDLLSAFEAEERPPRWYAHDVWHPNERGNDLIARHLVEPILLQLDLPVSQAGAFGE